MREKEPTKSIKAKPQAGKATSSNGEASGAKKATATRKPAVSARQQDDLQHRIQQRAYELWESEGRPDGREHAHWQQAQHEIARARSPRAGAKL
jgi:Protein of unknown function (DUF2934)